MSMIILIRGKGESRAAVPFRAAGRISLNQFKREQ